MKDIPFIYLPWQIKNSEKLQKKDISQTFSDEFEFLLPRGLKFKIIKKELINYKGSFDSWSTFQSIKKMSFDKFSKLLVNMGIDINSLELSENKLSKMNNEDFKNLYNKITNKIMTYHLEYIGQENIESVPPFIYNSKINLHISNLSSSDKNKFKSKTNTNQMDIND